MIKHVFEKLSLPFSKAGAKRMHLDIIPDYFSKEDIQLIKAGDHSLLHKKFGSHPMALNDIKGAYFALWAPHAKSISVCGDFNGWKNGRHKLNLRQDHSGIWEGFIPGAEQGDLYKYSIVTKGKWRARLKADPYAVACEPAPKTASKVHRIRYSWADQSWMAERASRDFIHEPMSIYEVHLGSWMRRDDGGFLTYRELAEKLVPYIKSMAFTHIEIMPLMEHPFYGSWGYQALSYFAPTGRYGSPEDLMYLIDKMHESGIGVILDWVASHFPGDSHGLAQFDGKPLYECNELHPDWKSCMFNLGKNQTVDFLVSSAQYWINQYHIDGLRVDAVASMLYLDYSRQKGQWTPNIFGGKENIEAVSFLRKLNQTIKSAHPGVQIIAEDSTAWPNVSKPSEAGGLNFDMKWNMGWMHDTLKYFRRDPDSRGKFHDEISFCLHYAFSENFVLALSHDEVVHEKGSLIGKMPGTDKEKFSGLKALFGYMFGHPGKKLLFMGGEFAQWSEWDHDKQLDWEMLGHDRHKNIQQWVCALNKLYLKDGALHAYDTDRKKFEWIDMGKMGNAIFSFQRGGGQRSDDTLVICNFGGRAALNYRLEGIQSGNWSVALNSNSAEFGGDGAEAISRDLCGFNLSPLSAIFLKRN